MRNVIQLGLHKNAEWSYLTQENWLFVMRENLRSQYRLPTYFTQDESTFRYFGIDASPNSVDRVRKIYNNCPNAYFIACCLTTNFSIEKIINADYSEEMCGYWNEFWGEEKHILYPGMPLSFLIENLGVEDISVLASDIDYSEVNAFSDIHAWKIKPEMISYELAVINNPVIIDAKIKNAGYIHFRTVPQYTLEESEESFVRGWMHEHQFIRADIFQEHPYHFPVYHVLHSEESKEYWLTNNNDVDASTVLVLEKKT